MIGPYKCVQTVVVRGIKNKINYVLENSNKIFLGLVASWKQPVYYNYDTPMTKQILSNIICSLYEVGYNVVAIVSDMGHQMLDYGVIYVFRWTEHTLNIL